MGIFLWNGDGDGDGHGVERSDVALGERAPINIQAPEPDRRGAAAKRRGRPRGHALSADTRRRMQCKQAQRRKRETEHKLAVVAERSANSSLARQASDVFSLASLGKRANKRSRAAVVGDEAMAAVVELSVDRYRTDSRLRDRGLVSHVVAQSASLANMCEGAGGLIVTSVFDDASMWVQHKGADHEGDLVPSGARMGRGGVGVEFPRGRGGRGGRGGVRRTSRRFRRNKHQPVLNVVQTAFALREATTAAGCPALEGCNVVVPAQVMPQANWPTVHAHWQRWGLLTSAGPGRALAAGNLELGAAVGSVPFVGLLLVADNLELNNCVVGREQRGLDSTRPSAHDQISARRAVLSVSCAHHSGALTTRASGDRVLGLSAALVRLGHLLESGRTMEKYRQAIKELVDSPGGFEFHIVRANPPDFERWREERERVLAYSSGALDLKPGEIEAIASFDNGDWSEPVFRHYHVAGVCDCGCETFEEARETMRRVALLCVGGGFPVPLEYRWKHMERANFHCLRGVRYHDCLPRMLAKVWPRAHKLAAAATARQGEAHDFNTTQQIRASRLMRFFQGDPRGHSMERFAVLTKPSQRFMNAAFKVDSMIDAFYDALAHGIVAKPAEDGRPLADALLTYNVSFLAGDRGRQVVIDYTSLLLDYHGLGWQTLTMGEGSRFDAALAVVCSMADAYRRLQLYYEPQPKS